MAMKYELVSLKYGGRGSRAMNLDRLIREIEHWVVGNHDRADLVIFDRQTKEVVYPLGETRTLKELIRARQHDL